MTRSLEAFAKLFVVISVLTALAVETSLGARAWAPLPTWVAALFVAGLVAGWLRRPQGWWPVLVTWVLIPVIFRALIEDFATAQQAVWSAPMLGLMLGSGRWRGATRWAFPAVFRWPLIYWALTVAAIWPVIAFRELDFRLAMLDEYRIGNSILGGQPWILVEWIANVAVTHLLGLLWFDHVCQRFRGKGLPAFLHEVVWPVSLSVAIGALIALYQGLVDIHFLSGHQWPSLGRAAGSLLDGDAFGALVGSWSAAFVALAAVAATPLLTGLALAGAAISWGGLWMTGSRMALLSGLVGGLAVVVGLLRVGWAKSTRVILWVVGGCLVVALAMSFVLSRAGVHDPVTRTLAELPELSKPAMQKYARDQFWNRAGPFGSVFLMIMERYPAVGVGVGSFQHLVPSLGFQYSGEQVYDNAQSWPRHQLAEYGWLGSLGWLSWSALLLWTLVRHKSRQGPLAGMALKGAVVAFGVISQISMPSQNPFVELMFWVFVAWLLVDTGQVDQPVPEPRRVDAAIWLAMLGVVGVFVTMSWTVANTELRPPLLALETGWGYRYGFYEVERPEGQPAFAWTQERAVDVLEQKKPGWLRIRIGAGPPDIEARPVQVTLSYGGTLVASYLKSNQTARDWYVRVGDGRVTFWQFIEITTSRVWRPSDFGGRGDDRELGLRVDDWVIVDALPPGAEVIAPVLPNFPHTTAAQRGRSPSN